MGKTNKHMNLKPDKSILMFPVVLNVNSLIKREDGPLEFLPSSLLCPMDPI